MTSTAVPSRVADETEPSRPDDARTTRWAWLNGDYARVFAVVLAWNVVLIAVAYLFGPSSPTSEGIPKTGIGSTASLLAHTYRWDAGNYGEIAVHAYTGSYAPTRAFYPVFPILVWLVQTISFGTLGLLAAGFLVNLVATWLAAVALLKIGRHFFAGERAPWLVVAAFLTAPAAFFLHAFYSEAVFCALGFWAYLFALRRQWLWMGLTLIPLTASRITAAVFVGLCFLEFWRSKDWKLRGLLSWDLLWFPAAFVGLGGVLLYMKLQTGDAFASFNALKGVKSWSYHKFNPNILETLWGEAKITGHALLGDTPMDAWTLMSHVLPMIGLALLFVSSVYVLVALRAKGIPLALFGFASIVMLTMNSNVVSVHRYLLPCLVMYVALVLFGERRPQLRGAVHVVLYANALVCGTIYIRFITGFWAG
ncbi:mannosyltransferase family protein [Amycolatopsis sp. NPDC049688]|uniref:mannosyltransferase family protein n=1 Tax=Amycolatopsis sp. NPDC049688 TaxID=3154733 RepID=UPI0034150D0B